jgi:hypothetical protein
VAILREVLYEGWIHQDITKVCEPKHRYKILDFKNITRLKIHIKE